ncbi:ABC transporter permease [Maribacter sp. 2210JD10-5]|uniref:ABC transporter permease n=1 Tax=Maribacter sp. 2210JD10-5 TaxID=3386272 RepID=UPI0039BCF7AD
MKKGNIVLFMKHFLKNVFNTKVIYALLAIFMLLTAYAAVSGITNYAQQNAIRLEHQRKARQSWEANPDKHPHRMAHFGSFAFRMKQPLSMFDYGIESFTGNAVFLEAHRQNSVNFSDAGFSTGTLRFGELSMAMLLQLVLPLILFFLGFSVVVSERENGTLKILLSQGAQWKEILLGKALGLFVVALLFFAPIVLVTMLFLVFGDIPTDIGDSWQRFLVLFLGYVLFLMVLSVLSIAVSTTSRSAKNALLTLLGIWLLMVVLVPKTAQAVGNALYPTPSKLSFQSAVERDVIKKGDSHNPDDPYFNRLKDSVLTVHGVDSVTQLPFNYGGFVMREGEKTSAHLYKKHHDSLLNIYEKQNNVSRYTAVLNPFVAVKNISMAFTGTDFKGYVDFQDQAETYRYQLAQEMNELQIEYIGAGVKNSEGKVNVVEHEHWEEFPDFEHRMQPLQSSVKEASLGIFSLLGWVLFSFLGLGYLSKKAKAL